MAIDPGTASEDREHRIQEGEGQSYEERSEDAYTEEVEDTSADYSTGVHNRPWLNKNKGSGGGGGGGGGTGPQRTRGITHTSPAPGIFDDYSGPQVDAAKTIIKQEMTLLGFPQGVDTEQMALDILKNGLENQPQTAYEHIWDSSFLTNDMRKASPWARFGMDADTFHANLASVQDLISRMTGMNVALDPGLIATTTTGPDGKPVRPTTQPPGEGGPTIDTSSGPMALLLQSALKGGWSQQQILDAFQAGSFTDIGGQKVDLTGITAAEPWLMSGQTYQQQAQQFRTIYGAAPVDTAQLAGWFRFNQTAAQIGPWYARQAVTEAVPKTPFSQGQQSIVR